jgi:hypothetical protein
VSVTVCVFGNILDYPEGGGVLWEYLNWALGLRSLGCRVIWMEGVKPESSTEDVRRWISALQKRLNPYGLAQDLAVCSRTGETLGAGIGNGCLDLEEALEADLLLNLGYHVPAQLVKRFRRSAMVDVDPGLTQLWLNEGSLDLAEHDLYFTTGETVGTPGALFPNAGIEWHYTPPCVALDWWPTHPQLESNAAFSTISQWYADEWVTDKGELYSNNKREGFLPFLELPRYTSQPLELALGLGDGDEEECRRMQQIGWRIREAHSISVTPWDYQSYIQGSVGEFSCVKPSCVKLQNAWMSDRTICYLASGKPAVVQHTGPSRFLPDEAGLFRFRTVDEAARFLDVASSDYEHQCLLARALAEEYFDARRNIAKVLEKALN